jgi:sigma-54 dependent transcriptional regulator, acetoin dehydrogenase operon transcriptional activator AcoR
MNAISHAEVVLSTLAGNTAFDKAQPQRSRIVASWGRCVEKYGLEPDKVSFPTIVTAGELKDYRAPIDDLIALATPEVDRLFERFAQHDYLVSMTDTNGVMVLFRSREPYIGDCARSGVVLGSVWSEESQGTNGIGTCIKERSPISVVMDNHFGESLVGLSCTVAPIFGRAGHLAAVLNVSTARSSDQTTQSIIREIVSRSARRIENLYFARRHVGRELLRVSRYNDFSDIAGEVRVALDDAGRIADATPDAVRLMSQRNVPLLGRSLTEFGALEARSLDEFGQNEAAIDINGHRLFVRRVEGGKRQAPTSASPRTFHVPRQSAPDISLLVGDDASMLTQVRRVQKLVDRRLPILLQGETGSGKTALAKALHAASGHAAGPFVSINCAAIPPELIESELFGYRPGAFTGASKQGAKGRIAEADGGTLFLDEIGDMPLALQTRLLQVLSDGEFVPVGGTQPTKVQFALISASLHDIVSLVEQGRFRQDLYFRLNGATLAMPPLRLRADRHFLIEQVFLSQAKQAGLPNPRLDEAARRLLLAHSWPGNIRELHHVARFAATLAEGSVILPRDLPVPFNPAGLHGSAVTGESERQALEKLLRQTGWNVKLAAQRLGISRATVHRRISALGLKRSEGTSR